MLDEPENSTTSATSTPRRRAAGRPAGPPKAALSADIFSAPDKPAAKKAAKPQRATQETAPTSVTEVDKPATSETVSAKAESAESTAEPAKKTAAKKAPAKKAPAKKAAAKRAAGPAVTQAIFQAPETIEAPPRKKTQPKKSADADDKTGKSADERPEGKGANSDDSSDQGNGAKSSDADNSDEHDDEGPRRRRRSRGGRRRRKPDNGDSTDSDDSATGDDDDDNNQSLRRRRRRRAGEESDDSSDDPENTVVRVRERRSAEDEITGVTGSTRLEAKKQRRREGREAGRRRAPIVSEAEFLARREAVKREMVIRQREEFTQIAVLEDDVLVEHYVARESQTSIIGNVYLGKIQNVLPSMEAAFVDIGKGRNAVLYAGEVDWTTLGNGKQRKIEDALSPGQTVLVQVTKDPIGQKGARLSSQISLAGRFLVYVPGGQTSGISRKLPDTERTRLKTLLKEVLPDEAGVIVRTAAEGASEEQLTRDVTALTARWEDIERKVEAGNAPELLYGEPDLMIKVVRDLFNEDFNTLVVEGDDAWDMISGYINHVAPDLIDRLKRWDDDKQDSFAGHRIGEQIAKALERKVYLPSGGSLVIDRTEAMTVVDVNTGKFTGTGGNLEETVTKNNLEAAEEIVRQLRLRDIGGIIVIDFIDMVLENNRDLVLRRLVECLGRDRTRHQVAEVTSLGLVQMTRKRIGTGLVEAFSEDCSHCHGRGVVIKDEPVEPRKIDDHHQRRNRRGGGSGGGGGGSRGNHSNGNGNGNASKSEAKPADKAAQPEAKPADKAAQPEAKPADKAAQPEAGPIVASEPAADVAKPATDNVEKAVDGTGPKAPAEGSADGSVATRFGATEAPVLTDKGNAP